MIRTYSTAYEFVLPDGEPFDQIFQQSPTSISLLVEPQGEGICYAIDGGDLITTSEVNSLGLSRFFVYVTPAR